MAHFRYIAVLAALAIALPAAAQETDRGPLEELGRDADRLLEELVERLGPALRDLEEELRDLDRYEAPEILPNGDIIIRRKRPLDDPGTEGEAPGRDRDDAPGRRDSGESDESDVTDT